MRQLYIVTSLIFALLFSFAPDAKAAPNTTKKSATKTTQSNKTVPKKATPKKAAPKNISKKTLPPAKIIVPSIQKVKQIPIFNLPHIAAPSQPQSRLAEYAGSYRCWSYNVSGGGSGNCRLFAPIVLKDNGTYSVSSEKGTYTITGSTITLSESKLRGPGTLIDGNKIRFEYDYNGWHHVVTYLKGADAASASKPDAPLAPQSKKTVGLELTISYPASSGPGWMNTIMLVPSGTDIKTSELRYDMLAYVEGNALVARRRNDDTVAGVQTGRTYDVYTSSGLYTEKVGTLDLTSVSADPVKKTIIVASPAETSAKQSDPVQVAPPVVEPPKESSQSVAQSPISPSLDSLQQNLPLCNPNIPKYSQAACREK